MKKTQHPFHSRLVGRPKKPDKPKKTKKPKKPPAPHPFHSRLVGAGGTVKPKGHHHKPEHFHPGLLRHGKKRGLALDGLPCCVAAAIGASLALAKGTSWDELDTCSLLPDSSQDDRFWLQELDIPSALSKALTCGFKGFRLKTARPGLPGAEEALLLGLELPGPHSVLAYGGAWFTWGNWYDPASFPDAIIEEIWSLQWLT